MSNHPGFFVVFEGGDGAGKSTQVKKLTQKLESLNETVVLTREPGGTESVSYTHLTLPTIYSV